MMNSERQNWAREICQCVLVKIKSISLTLFITAFMFPAGACTVADFKMLAHVNHNPQVRETAARNWLIRNGPGCNQAQLKIIQSSAANWLGSSLSPEISIIMDGLNERKIAGDQSKLVEYYLPAIKTFTPSVEKFSNPQAPAPVVQPMSGLALGYGGMSANSNVNNNIIYNGTDKDEKEKEPAKKYVFTDSQRKDVKDYFDKTRDDIACRDPNNKEWKKMNGGSCASGCPSSMIKNGESCTSIRRSKKLAVGQPFPPVPMPKEIPIGLREKIGPNPEGHKYLQLYEDILLVRDADSVVVDIILDLGGLMVINDPNKGS